MMPGVEYRLPLDRTGEVVAPFAPGTIIVPCARIPQQLQNEESVRRTDAALSVGDDVLVRGDSYAFQQCPQLVTGLEDWYVFTSH